MKKSDIRHEAKDIISTVFSAVLASDDKEKFKKAIAFSLEKVSKLELGDRGKEMFVWREVTRQLTNMFGMRFIKGRT